MTKGLSELSSFIRKITYLPCTMMGSWSTHTMETIFSFVITKTKLLIFVEAFDQKNYVLFTKKVFD